MLKEDLEKARDKNEKLQATLNEFNEMFGMIGAVTHARMVEDVTLATIATRPAPRPHLLPRAKQNRDLTWCRTLWGSRVRKPGRRGKRARINVPAPMRAIGGLMS